MTEEILNHVVAMLNSSGDILDTLANMDEVTQPTSWVCLAARAQVEVIGRLCNQVSEEAEGGPWEGFAKHCEGIADYCARAEVLLKEGMILETEDNESWVMWVHSIPMDIGDALSMIPKQTI